MTVVQLWSTTGAVVALLTAASGAGYEVGTHLSSVKIEKKEIDLSKKEIELSTLMNEKETLAKEKTDWKSKEKELNDKEIFLSLFLRFQLAKTSWQEARYDIPTSKNGEERELTQEEKSEKVNALRDKYIKRLEAFDAYLFRKFGKQKFELHKGAELVTITLPDNTNWTIPGELHIKENE